MKQRDYERVCRTMEELCYKLFSDLEENDYKNRKKFLRYATIFCNLAKIKLRKSTGDKL